MSPVKTVRRITLVEQVVEVLKDFLRQGRWPEQLPGEHQLADELQVGRSTLRIALNVLRTDGLVSVSQGRRHWITPHARKVRIPATKTIGFVLGWSIDGQMAHTILIVDELRRYLQQKGFSLVVVAAPRRRTELQKFQVSIKQTWADCWVLASCSMELQQWFAGER